MMNANLSRIILSELLKNYLIVQEYLTMEDKSKLDSMGGRKFLITLISQILFSFLLWHAKMDGDTYLWSTSIVTGAFITGNAFEWKFKTSPPKDLTTTKE